MTQCGSRKDVYKVTKKGKNKLILLRCIYELGHDALHVPPAHDEANGSLEW